MKNYAKGEKIPPWIMNDDRFYDASNAKDSARRRAYLSAIGAGRGCRPARRALARLRGP